MYGLLCGLARAVAVKLWNKLWYCRIHGCYTGKEMPPKCCCLVESLIVNNCIQTVILLVALQL